MGFEANVLLAGILCREIKQRLGCWLLWREKNTVVFSSLKHTLVT